MRPSERTNRNMLNAYFDALNAREPDRVASFYTSDSVLEDTSTMEKSYGTEEIKMHVRRHLFEDMLLAFPGMRFEIIRMIESHDDAAVEWVLKGKQEGIYMGIPPSGKEFEVKGTTVFVLRDSKIRYATVYWNPGNIAKQLRE